MLMLRTEESQRRTTGKSQEFATEMSERFLSRFLPDEVDQLLPRYGFGDAADFGPDDARGEVFRGSS